MKASTSQVSCSEGNLQCHLEDTRALVERRLKNFLSGISDLALRPLLEYALLTNGKRLRPIIVVMSAESVGATPDEVIELALSFELLHTATLVHDDMIDQDLIRRGTRTLYSRWSDPGAILSGDALIALSIDLAANYGQRIVKTLSSVGFELCSGEYADATLALENATEEQYFAKISRKSASLFRGAAYCGALAAKGKAIEAKALARYGENFGMAYQINDDLQDLLEKSRVSQDLRNGNVTLPLLFMYERGSDSAKNLLRNAFGNRTLTLDQQERIKDMMNDIGAFRYCRQKIMEYSEKSKSSLKDIRESTFKDYLNEFAYCVRPLET